MAMQSQLLGDGSALNGILGDVFNVVGAVGEIRNAQEQGDNAVVSLAKGIGNFTWGEFYYGGVARIVNERGYHYGADKVLSLGSVFSGASKKVGQGIGGAVGGSIGGIGGTIASATGMKGALKGGLVGGAKLGAKIGGTAGSFIGGMIPVTALTMAPQMIAQLPKMWEHTANIMTNSYDQRGRFGSGYFEMTQAGYTMRQRSLNAIRQNGLNTQSVLGNEARTYFRGSGLDY